MLFSDPFIEGIMNKYLLYLRLISLLSIWYILLSIVLLRTNICISDL